MRIILFAKRNTKEVLRDPINLFFGLGFSLIMLMLLSITNSMIPSEVNNPVFSIENLAPGMAMFGTVFLSLFAGMLLAKDRTSSFLMRLFTSPMTAASGSTLFTAARSSAIKPSGSSSATSNRQPSAPNPCQYASTPSLPMINSR